MNTSPSPRRRARWLRRLALVCAVLYAAASCVGCAVVNAAMFHPPRPPYGTDLPGLVAMGPPDAPVAGVWSPAPGATRAVLFSHGNGEDLRYVHGRLAAFNRLGLSALAWDYPGYGRTPGKPTEKTVYAAAETAFRHLVEERGFAASNIVLCGYSIGSGPACWLAEQHPDAGALLLLAPFKSAVRVVTRVRLLPFDPFPNLARIARTRCPVLVLHGTADRLIPAWHGEAVAAAAGDRGRFVPVPGATHDTVFRAAFADSGTAAILRAFLASRAEAAEVDPHAESAEWRPTPEQTGRFRFDDEGKVIVVEVDAEGRVRLLETEPDSPPLRLRPATIRNRDLFVVEMDDIPDTGLHWTLALDFDVAKRAWIVVGEGETAADIVPGKPGYRTAAFRRIDEPPFTRSCP